MDIVDPLLKIVHAPTVQKHVMNAIRDRGGLDPAMECLLPAIYYLSVASMPATDCRDEVGEEKPVVLARYYPRHLATLLTHPLANCRDFGWILCKLCHGQIPSTHLT